MFSALEEVKVTKPVIGAKGEDIQRTEDYSRTTHAAKITVTCGPHRSRMWVYMYNTGIGCVQHGTYRAHNNNKYAEECKRGEKAKKGEKSEVLPSFYLVSTANVHTHEPCIMASHALLLCKVFRKWARFGSDAAS